MERNGEPGAVQGKRADVLEFELTLIGHPLVVAALRTSGSWRLSRG